MTSGPTTGQPLPQRLALHAKIGLEIEVLAEDTRAIAPAVELRCGVDEAILTDCFEAQRRIGAIQNDEINVVQPGTGQISQQIKLTIGQPLPRPDQCQVDIAIRRRRAFGLGAEEKRRLNLRLLLEDRIEARLDLLGGGMATGTSASRDVKAGYHRAVRALAECRALTSQSDSSKPDWRT